jgi:hypothetical protein
MAKAEDYRRYAAECVRFAQKLRDQAGAAALLLEMAERWRTLAEQAERQVRGLHVRVLHEQVRVLHEQE